jgi:hypothetical protein
MVTWWERLQFLPITANSLTTIAAFVTDVKPGSDAGFVGYTNPKANLLVAVYQPGDREEDAQDGLLAHIGTKPHPPGIAISKGKKVMKEMIAKAKASRVSEEVRA